MRWVQTMLLFFVLLQMTMVFFMTVLVLWLIMVMRRMGRRNQYDDSHSISSITKSTIVICTNTKNSTILWRHPMSRISINRWARTFLY